MPPDLSNRPILIDPADGPCEICAAHQAGHCDECHQAIPHYPEMAGNGFVAPRPSHYHIVNVEGVPGREAKAAELCLECFREQWQMTYPNETFPISF